MTDDTPGFADAASIVAPPPAVVEDHTPSLSLVVCLGIGAAAALIGLLPWLLTGMRLPLQNLWATVAPPEAMPIALLPLSQYSTTLIPGLLITGAGIAGLVARGIRHRLPRRGILGIALGVVLVYAIAGVQAWLVVAGGLERSDAARFYLNALVAVAIVSIALALAVLLLISRAPVPGATIGLSAAALAAGISLNSLLGQLETGPGSISWVLLGLAQWVPAVLVGTAIGWCGVRTAGRIVAVLVSVLALWIGAAAITAVSAATGTRILLQYPLEMLDYGFAVFRMAVGMPELVVPPLIAAVVVGVVVWLARRFLRKG
ncbi:hypothetical protein ACFFGH_28165 [Lysobacter korlensis]|uniref:Uncharacterized protein n=1 Tax=Lysobacter korlensis TaxID=553636 RepID=A0ABV6RXL9_9GAMM